MVPSSIRIPFVAQIQSGIIFGITAALYGQITIKDGRVEQNNFYDYQLLRMNEAPSIDVHIVESFEPPGGMGEAGTSRDRPGNRKCNLRRHGEAASKDADQLGVTAIGIT